MALPDIDFTTGPSHLPDVGVLFYNGCTFSPLFESNVFGKCVKDDAQRTVMYMEYTITVDGYATLPAGAADTHGVVDAMRRLLSKQGGELRYIGRGNDIEVNVPGSAVKDVKWGPIPEVLELQPLGAGRSVKVKWTCKVHIIEPELFGIGGPGKGPGGGDGPDRPFIPGSAGPGGGGGGGGFNGGIVKPGPSKVF